MNTRRKPAQWDLETAEAYRDEFIRRMIELNDSPVDPLVRELADTLYFERHPEKRN